MKYNIHDEVIANYLTRFPDRWDDGSMNVHVSEVGSCVRKVAYRLARAEALENPPTTVRLFHLGNYIHNLHYRALEHANLMYRKEVSLNDLLPKGLVGRYDYLRMLVPGDDSRVRLGDDKTQHPNYLRYVRSYPKENNVIQISLYHMALLCDEIVAPRLDERVEINYMDRGGSNPSLTTIFKPLPEDTLGEQCEPYLKLIEGAEKPEDIVPEDVPMLEPHLYWSYRNKWGGGYVSWGPSWECGYCRYRQCPQWHKKSDLVVKVAKSYGYQWTTMGQRLLRKNPERLSAFLFGETQGGTLVGKLIISGPNTETKTNNHEESRKAAKSLPLPTGTNEDDHVTEVAGEPVEREIQEDAIVEGDSAEGEE